MKNPVSNDSLKEMLSSWQVGPEFRADFNREVWSKIATREVVRPEGFWHGLIAMIFAAPRYATAMALVALFAGFATAQVAANNANSRHWVMLEERYAQSINPLVRSAMKE